jgi:hypothetical protein
MTYASAALVVVLGTASILTNDPRFILVKPSIGHFAIGAIMLRRNWMQRYMPEIVRQNGPDLILRAGYCWARADVRARRRHGGNALTGNMRLWTFYVTVALVGASSWGSASVCCVAPRHPPPHPRANRRGRNCALARPGAVRRAIPSHGRGCRFNPYSARCFPGHAPQTGVEASVSADLKAPQAFPPLTGQPISLFVNEPLIRKPLSARRMTPCAN